LSKNWLLQILSKEPITKPAYLSHPGESLNPELPELTGFRVKRGMTKDGKIDF
jgi:hypothetical protein